MTVPTFLGVAAAGGIGAVLRFVIDGLIRGHVRVAYPVATTVINLTGSLLLGLLTGLVAARVLPEEVRLLVGTGLLGGYTTFSTASVEAVRLAQDRRWGAALGYGVGTLAAAVLAASLGYALGSAL